MNTLSSENKLEPLPKKILPREVPIPFDEKFKWNDLNATFTAKSFTLWMEKTLPIIKTLEPMNWQKAKKDGVMLGDSKVFYLRPLPLWYYSAPMRFMKDRPTRSVLSVYRREVSREICFDAEINIPILADKKDMNPWMSLTPNEVFTLRGQIRRSKGDTAIAGLGLGWVARKILERKKVTHLTVYEKDESLIDYFGASLVEDFGSRITLVHADAYKVDWMKHEVALWDIWPQLGDAAWDKEYLKIRRKMRAEGKTCVGWGEGVKI